MHYYTDVLKKYAQFEGRASRKEFWMFVLISSLVSLALFLVGNVVHMNFLVNLYGLAVLIPYFAVTARRFHDVGQSGWWLLTLLIPLVGFIILLIFTLKDSQPGDNKYGPNPKGVMAPQMAQTPQNPNTPNPMM